MKKEKVTIIKPKKVKEHKDINFPFLEPIIILIIGIILFTSSDKLIVLICKIIGILIVIFGIYNLIKYYKIKKEFNYDDNTNLIIGSCTTFIGIITIILASAIEIGIRYIIGFALIYKGYKNITFSLISKDYITLTEGIIYIILGLYSILAKNIIFTIIGLLMIISSIVDLIHLYCQKK